MDKKLSDNEIVKALDNDCLCVVYGVDCESCPLREKDCKILPNAVVDLINRQKAEIKRLTEENEYLDGCAKQFLADYQKCEIANTELQELNAKYYNDAKDLRRENKDLQKQVDELKIEMHKIESAENETYMIGFEDGEKQAVKDTAKEIFARFKNRTHQGVDLGGFFVEIKLRMEDLVWIENRYGVEVE